ncbi:MAG: SpoIIE family protein phosphatase, partial [Capsulimonadaceae bacterium]
MEGPGVASENPFPDVAYPTPPSWLAGTVGVDDLVNAFHMLIFARASIGFALVDRGLRYVQVNARMADLNETEVAQHLGRTVEDVVGRDIWELYRPHFERAIEGEPVIDFRLSAPLLRSPELHRHLVLSLYPIVAHEQVTGVGMIVLDVTEQSETVGQLNRSYARERLINQIGQAIRASTNATDIQEAAAQFLGKALYADRCYYCSYGVVRDEMVIEWDYRRPGLSPVAGRFILSDFRRVMDQIFARGTAIIHNVRIELDPETADALLASNLAALIAVPFYAGGNIVAALFVGMAEPREWRPDEIDLAERVATMTRSAIEGVRRSQHHRRVADELQDALQPSVPDRICGLSVASYMRAALDEAAIGGDFCDVFALEPDLCVLIVGDVSGKGLSAAGQLATVRNMLRALLYEFRSPVRAVNSLNTFLVNYELLLGFVTAFIGLYDARSGLLRYVSCGHEPALIRRFGGSDVEQLHSSGPPLGAAPDAPFAERDAFLLAGDTLMVYTDGLSEAGPSRQRLIGTDGLIRVLARLQDDLHVGAVAERILTEVGSYARGVF